MNGKLRVLAGTYMPGALFALTILTVVSACGTNVGRRVDPAASEVLWLPANATIELDPITGKASRTVYADGSGGVGFTAANADRDELTRQLAQHFEQHGWHARPTTSIDFPGRVTSFIAGWTKQACGCLVLTDREGKPIPAVKTSEWIGEWEDTRGDVITYSLRAIDDLVYGYAGYVPAWIVEKHKRGLSSSRLSGFSYQ
jgi:hypothetical protein